MYSCCEVRLSVGAVKAFVLRSCSRFACVKGLRVKIRVEPWLFMPPLDDAWLCIVRGFFYCHFYRLKGGVFLFRRLRDDIALVKEKDPAARSGFEILLTYSGLKAVRSYRRAHWFYKHGMFTIARIISQRARHKTGIEIHPGAQIGKGLFIDHGMGVVIGETTIIGDNCLLYQGVTLGGTGKDKGKRHPTLGDNVMVGAGAKVLGPICIGDNVKVAANAVVLKDIPDNCTAVGVPARIAVRDGVKVEQDLDQIHYPDLTMQDINELRCGMQQLKSEVDFLEHQYEEEHSSDEKSEIKNIKEKTENENL